jgi:hypothetical protein
MFTISHKELTLKDYFKYISLKRFYRKNNYFEKNHKTEDDVNYVGFLIEFMEYMNFSEEDKENTIIEYHQKKKFTNKLILLFSLYRNTSKEFLEEKKPLVKDEQELKVIEYYLNPPTDNVLKNAFLQGLIKDNSINLSEKDLGLKDKLDIIGNLSKLTVSVKE